MRIIDNIHGAFTDGIRNVHKRYPDGERKFDVGKISEILISDLKGDYQYNAGKEYIITKDKELHNEKIPINFASSGQQEVLWLLNQLYILMLKKEKAFVIIEEPEAHLYPNLQNKVVEFIAYFANVNESSIMVTTHSPYVIGNRCEIFPDNVMALKIEKDTSIQNLINDEYGEINTEMIDEISDRVNEKYTELFYLLTEKE